MVKLCRKEEFMRGKKQTAKLFTKSDVYTHILSDLPKPIMNVKPLINKVLITLEIEDKTALLILLTREGMINRKGNGSLGEAELPLARGHSADGHFEALMLTVPDAVFYHTGVIRQGEILGRECTLTIVFQGNNDVDFSFRVIYGDESQGPPVELAQILINAVKLTEPWYQDEISETKKEEADTAWWKFWK